MARYPAMLNKLNIQVLVHLSNQKNHGLTPLHAESVRANQMKNLRASTGSPHLVRRKNRVEFARAEGIFLMKMRVAVLEQGFGAGQPDGIGTRASGGNDLTPTIYCTLSGNLRLAPFAEHHLNICQILICHGA